MSNSSGVFPIKPALAISRNSKPQGASFSHNALPAAIVTLPSVIRKLRESRGISLAAVRGRLVMALIASGVVLSAGICAAPAEASTTNVYAVAYVGSDNNLWYYDGTSGAHDTGIVVGAETSPSMAAVSAGDGIEYAIAFEGDEGQLEVYYPQDNSLDNTGLQMEEGTDPAIATNNLVAFQGYNGDLWYWNGTGHDTGLGMGAVGSASGGSPSITPQGNDIAFKANTTVLWTYRVSTRARHQHRPGHGSVE
jgi:hypothetical protein